MIHHTGEPKSADTVPRSLHLLCFCLSGVQGVTSTSKAPGRPLEAPTVGGCLLLVRSGELLQRTLSVHPDGTHTEKWKLLSVRTCFVSVWRRKPI